MRMHALGSVVRPARDLRRTSQPKRRTNRARPNTHGKFKVPRQESIGNQILTIMPTGSTVAVGTHLSSEESTCGYGYRDGKHGKREQTRGRSGIRDANKGF